jgi:hypothetical protein
VRNAFFAFRIYRIESGISVTVCVIVRPCCRQRCRPRILIRDAGRLSQDAKMTGQRARLAMVAADPLTSRQRSVGATPVAEIRVCRLLVWAVVAAGAGAGRATPEGKSSDPAVHSVVTVGL